MFAEDTFAGMFATYAELWETQLRLRRSHGSIYIAGDWELFSQHHYAAIVRAWGAWQQRKSIDDLIESWTNTGTDRLNVHASVLGLYVHCTAVIDNLDKCASTLRENVARRPLQVSNWRKDWESIRLQRNLDAHDGLRPISDASGEPVIDRSLVDEEHKTWAGGTGKPQAVREWVDEIWKTFLNCAISAWSDLLRGCPPTDRSPPPTQPPFDGPSPASGTLF